MPELELICTVYNINPGENDNLLSKCEILYEYMKFIECIRRNEKEGLEEPIESAIEWCIENNILANFLRERKSEVLKAMTIDMTFERREELIRRDEREEGRIEGRLEGRLEGRIEGRNEGHLEMLIYSVKDGEISIESAANRLGISEEEFKTHLEN